MSRETLTTSEPTLESRTGSPSQVLDLPLTSSYGYDLVPSPVRYPSQKFNYTTGDFQAPFPLTVLTIYKSLFESR